MIEPKTDTLFVSNLVLKGNEPFLSFNRPSLIINLRDYCGYSHNFVEQLSTGIFSHLKSGETLQFQINRITTVNISWWERIKRAWRNL